MGTKDSFVVYTGWKEHLELLSDDEKGHLFMALIEYVSTGAVEELSPVARMAFSFMKAQIDADTQKYEATCQKRSEAGKLGGRPAKGEEEKQEKAKKANGFSEKQIKQTKAKKPDNEYEYEYDNENDTANAVRYISCAAERDESVRRGREKDQSVPAYAEIIAYLNQKAGTAFRDQSRDSRAHIRARYAEGYTTEDFYRVIDKKCADWVGTEYQKYLRPNTLFGAKFGDYLGELPAGKRKQQSGNRFCNFEQRQYDFAGLEKQLLGVREE